jgi:signal transduction histidine kinase
VAAALSAGTVAAGIGLLVGPRLRRVRAEAEAERRERIRIEERERVASRLHDSVLQTLALIQRAPDGERARQLARRQDRELRAWLYSGEDPDAPATLAGALRVIVDEIEEAYAVSVGLVQPADLPMDPVLEALVDAAREAVTNAAKHAGVDRINVLVRVSPRQVRVFVDDRGAGFDPDAVPADRRGLSDSIRARLARVGGSAAIETSPGGGTDVELLVPRDSTA